MRPDGASQFLSITLDMLRRGPGDRRAADPPVEAPSTRSGHGVSGDAVDDPAIWRYT